MTIGCDRSGSGFDCRNVHQKQDGYDQANQRAGNVSLTIA